MIALGSDHGGYSLKQEVKAYLEGKGIPYKPAVEFRRPACTASGRLLLVAGVVGAQYDPSARDRHFE